MSSSKKRTADGTLGGHEMNSSAANLDRTAFTFSRMLEYFSIKELQAQTGQPQHNFPVVVVKELIDNALDECEYSSVKPKIGLSFTEGCDCFEIRINDNGRGITPEVVTKILDFNTRTTTKAFYRTPTRGQLGNALKTVVGIPYALSKANAEVATRYPITIESCGKKHIINAD
jgi:DNA topoisomerase VI subunit B